MAATEKLTFNDFVGMHNLSLASEAKKLLTNFIGNGEGLVYIYNKDGSWLKLKPGFDIVAVDMIRSQED